MDDDYFGPDDDWVGDVPIFDIGMLWERGEDYSLLTNLPKSEKFAILRAAEMTPGFKDVIYLEDAYTPKGEKLEDDIAVKTRIPGRDHTAFWRTYEAIKARGNINRIRRCLLSVKGR